ncbi:MAG TPA: DUF882 domain-containing protein [Polyangia bacterium]
MLRLSLMLLTVMVGAQTAGADEGAPKLNVSAGSAASVSGHSRSAKCARRHRGKRSGKMLGWLVPEKELLAEPPAPPSGNLHIYSISYKAEAEVNIYNEDGSFNVQALADINHIFKCRRSGLEHEIDTRLVTILSHVYDHFGGKRIELLSGYRFQRRTTSNHFHGTAADIRIPGIDPRKIRSYVETLDAGGLGVGWYPKVGFVHVDVRQPPSYRWIDYSRSNPDARDRMLPRGFKRKDPES